MEVIAIGGYDEVGKNMTAVKSKDEIVIFDMGFYMPKLLDFEEGDPDPRELSTADLIKRGVLPDDNILDKDKDKVKAIIVGHCHLDHIGAVPYLAEKYDCPIIGTPYTLGILQTLLEERDLNYEKRLKPLNFNSKLKITPNLQIELLQITHSTIHTALVVLKTSEGVVVYMNDFKLDNHPVLGKKPDYDRLEEIGKQGVKALIIDSLKSNNEMKTPSEKVAREMLKDIIAGVRSEHNAIVVTTFSSHIARLKSIIDFGNGLNRKIIFLGRSLFKYVDVAERLQLIKFRDKVEIVGYRRLVEKRLKEIAHDKEKYLIVCTGNQGEKDSILSKMAYRDFQWNFSSGDIVIFSCKTIPTPETTKNRDELEKELKRQQVRIFKDIHVSGHASLEDHRDVLNLLKPEHLFPSHGPYEIIKGMEELGLAMGYKPGRTLHVVKNFDIVKI